MNQTATIAELHNAIVELLQSLPTINDSIGQQSFVRNARVDERLFKQIQFGGAAELAALRKFLPQDQQGVKTRVDWTITRLQESGMMFNTTE